MTRECVGGQRQGAGVVWGCRPQQETPEAYRGRFTEWVWGKYVELAETALGCEPAACRSENGRWGKLQPGTQSTTASQMKHHTHQKLSFCHKKECRNLRDHCPLGFILVLRVSFLLSDFSFFSLKIERKRKVQHDKCPMVKNVHTEEETQQQRSNTLMHCIRKITHQI